MSIRRPETQQRLSDSETLQASEVEYGAALSY
nr:MAG TPA: hypothetical protein [Caudoviricetes sp.]